MMQTSRFFSACVQRKNFRNQVSERKKGNTDTYIKKLMKEDLKIIIFTLKRIFRIHTLYYTQTLIAHILTLHHTLEVQWQTVPRTIKYSIIILLFLFSSQSSQFYVLLLLPSKFEAFFGGGGSKPSDQTIEVSGDSCEITAL